MKKLHLCLLKIFGFIILALYILVMLFSFDIVGNKYLNNFYGIFGILAIIGFIYLWPSMICHWKHVNFKSKGGKIFCLILITFGMFVGAWIYYFIVHEGKMFIKKGV